jgi:tRNA pseudouridine38-40 synthase
VRNLRLTIAYDGSAYSGWQIQPNAPTVQGAIENRLREMTQTQCRVRAAGRTDAGVHAEEQVASFLTESAISTRGFYRGLNALLPEDIAICSVEEVALDFDARRHNHGKLYRYSIWNNRTPDPQRATSAYHVHRPLDVRPMAEAARHFVGTHDFCAFRAASCERETTIRTLYRCTVARDGPLIRIEIEGTAFLRNMARIIAGTLLEVGKGLRDPGSMVELLRAGDRRHAGITAPAHGLCLARVFLAAPGER